MAGTFTIAGLSASEPLGQRTFGPLTIVGSIVVGETIESPLAQGDNTFGVPSGAVACLIANTVNGSSVLTLRTNLDPGDAGLPINGNGLPMVYPFPTGAPTSLIVNSSAAQAATLSIAFI